MIAALAATLFLAAPAAPSAPADLIIESVAVRGVRIGRRQAMVRQTGLAEGEPPDDASIAEARVRLLETGLFEAVAPRLERGSARGRVIVVFECRERPTTSLDAVHLGHARPTDLWGGLEVSDIDPFGLGLSLGAGLVGSEDQLAARLAVGRPGFFVGGSDLVVSGHFINGREPFVGPRGQSLDGVARTHLDVPYRRGGLDGALRFEFSPATHLTTAVRLEYVDVSLPRGEARQIDADGEARAFDFGIADGDGVLPSVVLGLQHDTRDDPAFPSRGLRASFVLSGGTFDGPFARFLAGFERYWSLPFRHVVRVDLKAGAIIGDAPFFERFFVGNLHPYIPGRALGLNFARRRGPNILDRDIDEQRYEDVAGRLGVEYRLPVGKGPRVEVYGVEFFVSGALVTLGTPAEVESDIGPSFPLDLAIDAGLRIESEIGVMGFSVGTLFLVLESMTTLLALAALLAAPAPAPWVERDGPDLRVSASVAGFFDAALRRRLTSGLATTLHVRVEIRPTGGGEPVGDTWRNARARWDLWDEKLTVIVDSPEGAQTRIWPSVDAFVADFSALESVTTARGVAANDSVYRAHIILEVNPLSITELARMRRWLASPKAGANLDPLSGTLLGSFVRFFDNYKPGLAERVLRAEGPPFRADRLPFYRRSRQESP